MRRGNKPDWSRSSDENSLLDRQDLAPLECSLGDLRTQRMIMPNQTRGYPDFRALFEKRKV